MPMRTAITILMRYGVVAASLATLDAVAATGTAVCNANPFLNRIFGTPVHGSVDDFGARFAADPSYRARFGGVAHIGRTHYMAFENQVILAFPPLADPALELERVRATGDLRDVWLDGYVCFATSPADQVGSAVEYHNAPLDHYFYTADENEKAAVDAGEVGPAWKRTGQSFDVILQPGCPEAIEGRFHPVYRFTGVPDIGPSSHVFTASQQECAVLRDRAEWHWMFEGAPFWAYEPQAGTCPDGTTPLYRVYNNSTGGTPNHRFTTSRAIVDETTRRGWFEEGLVMCVK
jgi:hypothetical protein